MKIVVTCRSEGAAAALKAATLEAEVAKLKEALSTGEQVVQGLLSQVPALQASILAILCICGDGATHRLHFIVHALNIERLAHLRRLPNPDPRGRTREVARELFGRGAPAPPMSRDSRRTSPSAPDM